MNATGINELMLSWKPPVASSSGSGVPVSAYIVEGATGVGHEYKYVLYHTLIQSQDQCAEHLAYHKTSFNCVAKIIVSSIFAFLTLYTL